MEQEAAKAGELFHSLRPVDEYRYRGSSGLERQELFEKIGIGPLRPVLSKCLAVAPDTLTAKTWSYVLGRANKVVAGNGGSAPWNPGSPREQIERLLDQIPVPLETHLATNDHIVDEDPIQYPSTASLNESLSVDPQTAILYAYGIHPDRREQIGQASAFYAGSANSPAVVGIIKAKVGGKPKFMANVTSSPEAGRRALRDDELLLSTLVPADLVVLLPPFQSSDAWATLDAAAKELVVRGVAKWA